MSDNFEELARAYDENVYNSFYGHPRSIGLFPIPEFPELEPKRGMWSAALDAILTTLRYLAPATLLTLFWGQQSFLFKLLKHIDSAFRARLFPIPEFPELEPKRGMWSAALDAILTTLRYLAPATLLTLFWGQQSFLFKLLKHIDSAFRAIVFSSEEQKQSVLQWLAEVGPVQVEHLDTVWRHGWIVCGVLDAALPGACAGHPPTRLSLKHAQAIADSYLGVEPVFSRQELESNDALSKHQEWKLATFLDRIRQSLSKLTPPVSKPSSQRTSPETSQFTLDYVARGSGLTAAQVNNKSHFKIYPTSQQSLDPGEITILIRGPKDTYGMTVLPPILGKAQLIRQKVLGLDSKPNYTENVLPITQGATYLRSYGKNDMNKTYHIPQTKYDIDITAEPRSDHTKISYTVNFQGKYDISITSRGQSIVGSPFTVTGTKNILSILERESFCLEDGEEIDIVDIKSDRKVVLRIVDFVTEKMLLKENGSLEKISDDEAKILMATDNNEASTCVKEQMMTKMIEKKTANQKQKKAFNHAVKKVIFINRISKIFNDVLAERYSAKKEAEAVRPYSRSQQHIPDVVNSTLMDTKINPYTLNDVRNKYIIPENINVSLRTEKSCEREILRQSPDTFIRSKYLKENSDINNVPEISIQNQDIINIYENNEEDEVMVITSSPSNPFLIDTYMQNYVTEKELGTFVATEYETNNSQNEETPESPIKILIEEDFTSSPVHSNNPFIDTEIAQLERPKTPVYKIITGDIKNRDDSVYVDPKLEKLAEELLGNEFINPFFVHQHHQSNQLDESLPITDFIIGAPVSLPPILRTSTPEPNLDFLIMTTDEKNTDIKETSEHTVDSTSNEESKSVFSTPLHNNMKVIVKNKPDIHSNESSTFHSLDSNLTENVDVLSSEDNILESYHIKALQSNQNKIPKKEIWDSAYVSIDENNSSPDTNNNENTQSSDTISKQKFSLSDDSFGTKYEDLTNMGPAEKELWQTCNELSNELKICDDTKLLKWESRRPIFTPIIEENDRSVSSGMKDMSIIEISHSKVKECDPVTVAFAELNDIYHDYFPETDSTTNLNNENKNRSLEVDNTKESKDFVDSASEIITDVKRHTNDSEGKISEVQANVTESVSASQNLPFQDNTNENNRNNEQVQFGDRGKTNIVLERKKYWDDRIRQIEEKSQETTTLQKKRRLSSKYLRHNDSLTKRRGKQIVKKFLSTGDIGQYTTTKPEQITSQIMQSAQELTVDDKPDVKLVDKWKKYWDEKLESENVDSEGSLKLKQSDSKMHSSSQLNIHEIKDVEALNKNNTDSNSKPSVPVKQELPEEVYKAFETSPKRFFGTSRKQILNKIDTFLGKPSTVDSASSDVTGASHDTGLVSSRISLFHNISNAEELPWVERKSNSLLNVWDRKDSHREQNSADNGLENETLSHTQIENTISHDSEDDSKQVLLKEKRSRIAFNAFNKSFDESVYQKPIQTSYIDQKQQKISSSCKENTYVQNTIKDFNKHDRRSQKYNNTVLRRKSFSKSEMDIFNKTNHKESDNDLEKYKSCDELPKVNVKNFISLYENVSKTSVNSKPKKRLNKMHSEPHKQWQANNTHIVAVNKLNTPTRRERLESTKTEDEEESTTNSPSLSSKSRGFNKSFESISSAGTDLKMDNESINGGNQESTFLSLSDIELEIVESSPDKSSKSPTPENEETAHIDYKSRFKMAKEYFQSLEELVEPKKPRKLNECELLLQSKPSSPIEEEKRPQKRVKKNIKSHSMPSSEISKIWNELQEKTGTEEAGASKLVKISEKFNVEDLFNDVMEGRLSRQGSLRGIPHKKAVLEAFRSMENLTDKNLSPYEIAVSQLKDFAKENQIRSAQTYLSEYPYLPTTDPSKYHSRVDTKASGLISLKEIINMKPRRNSVPDLRLNTSFTVNL